jgi:hypothetical protein
MVSRYKKGVFCLETDWYGDLKKPTTVKPILEMLEKLEGYEVPHIYRGIGTVQEFYYYVNKWTQKKYAEYPILYLAFHGESNVILVGDKRLRESRITLEELGDFLAKKCNKKIILFGSCSTLNTDPARVRAFLKVTGALAALGYRSDVEWVKSAMFELHVITAMQEYPLTRRGVMRMNERIVTLFPKLSRELTYKAIIAE